MARRPHPEGNSWGARHEVLGLNGVTQHQGEESLDQRLWKSTSNLVFAFFFFFLFTPCRMQDLSSLIRMKPVPLQWKHGALSIGSPGKS